MCVGICDASEVFVGMREVGAVEDEEVGELNSTPYFEFQITETFDG